MTIDRKTLNFGHGGNPPVNVSLINLHGRVNSSLFTDKA